MISIKDKKDCCGCEACVQRCPKRCITMSEDNEGFLYPIVNHELCIDCGLCKKVCPVINQSEVRTPIKVFATKNPDDDIRMQSSSGGIFTMLAEKTIDMGGVVFGAGFDNNWDVVHSYAETKEALSSFRGSKYVQSRIGETYKQAEIFLKQGRNVLFSGTPCQIAGLRLYLRKEYPNLFTVDFICHGVPSPGVWHAYLKEIMCPEGAAGKNTVFSSLNGMPAITGISFRDKRMGWKKYGFVIRGSISKETAKSSFLKSDKSQEQTVFYEPLNENLFLKGFLADLYLRPSCYSCPTKELKSGSDLTIADYWRIHESMPEIDDDKGISAILVNTDKGQELFDSISAEVYESTYDDIRLKNSAVYHSSTESIKRKEFFIETDESLSEKIQRLCRLSFAGRIRRLLSVVKNKLFQLIRK